ncbi:MAG: crotonobetaine/carnitine-CoA ligase, partial [Halioglobus sp.]
MTEIQAAAATTDPRVPARDVCVTRYLLQRWDREIPEKIFAVFEDGETWSYSQ